MKYRKRIPPAFEQPVQTIPSSMTNEGGYLIRRKRASLNEFNVGNALDYFELPFIFQVYFMGGSRIRGGQILDFLVFAPLVGPVQVYGDYWHSGQRSSTDRYKINVLEQFLKRKVVIVWGHESKTYEQAVAAVRKKVL